MLKLTLVGVYCKILRNKMYGGNFMKNFKLTRNLWIFAGLCFLLAFIISLGSSKSTLLHVLNGITCILMFINAYINHRKILKDKDKD
jgi:hypothetical protein